LKGLLHVDDPDKTVGMVVCELFDDTRRVYDNEFKAINSDLEFALELAHYKDPASGQAKGLGDDMQPVGLELFDLIRSKTGRVNKMGVYLDCRPVDDMADPVAVEDAKFALEHVIYDPLRRYMAHRRRAVLGAVAARRWVMAVDFDPTLGPFGGEIYYRLVDPTRFMRAPGCLDMHDMTCPFVFEDGDLATSSLLGMEGQPGWMNLDQLKPDGAKLGSDGLTRSVSTSPTGHPRPGASQTDTTHVVKLWLREDPERADPVATGDYQPLPPEGHYFVCANCGLEMSPEESYAACIDPMTGQEMADLSQGLPDYGPLCPKCSQQPLESVQHWQEESAYLKYPNGRLVWVAYEQQLVIYDSGWPIKCRSFPYFEIRNYEHPRYGTGNSDTSIQWTQQVYLDGLMLFAYEQMHRNVDIIVSLKDGLVDAAGMPYIFNNQHGNVAYATSPMSANLLQHFQGSGIPAGLMPLYQMVAARMQATMGSADLSIGPQQSKDIPVGTVRQMAESGMVPVDDFVAAMQDDEGIFLGVSLDYIIATWTQERWVRYRGMNGMDAFRLLSGSNIPNVDVFVSGTPNLEKVSADDMAKFSQWAAMPIPARRTVAKLTGIHPSIVSQYEKDEADFNAMMIQNSVADMNAEDDATQGDGGAQPPGAGQPAGQGEAAQ
jgi:hypothetical protein